MIYVSKVTQVAKGRDGFEAGPDDSNARGPDWWASIHLNTRQRKVAGTMHLEGSGEQEES